MVLNTRGGDAPDRRVLQPDPEKREPCRDADQNAGDNLHQQVPLDLAGDFVQDLDGDFLLAERGTRDPDQLAPEGIARGQQKIDEEQHDAGLTGHGGCAQRSRPEVILDVQLGALDLHARHAARRGGCLDSGLVRRPFQLVGGLLHVVDCTGGGHALLAQRPAEVLRGVGQGLDQRCGIVTERIGQGAGAADDPEQQYSRPEGTRNSPLLQAVDERGEGVADQHAQHDRDAHRARPVQHRNDREHGQQRERPAPGVTRGGSGGLRWRRHDRGRILPP